MTYFEEISKELEENPEKRAEYEAMEVPSYETFLESNRQYLRMPPERKERRTKRLLRFVSAAAGFILFLSLGLGLYYGLRHTEENPSDLFRYTDDDITKVDRTVDDLLRIESLYLPDLDILEQQTFMVGEHNETHEPVYFYVRGVFDYGELQITIIIHSEYKAKSEEKYTTDNITMINGYIVSVYNAGYFEPFYNYKLGFTSGTVRYYIDYSTIEENDYDAFLTEFLK